MSHSMIKIIADQSRVLSSETTLLETAYKIDVSGVEKISNSLIPNVEYQNMFYSGYNKRPSDLMFDVLIKFRNMNGCGMAFFYKLKDVLTANNQLTAVRYIDKLEFTEQTTEH